tara:strand:+ start:45 stop:641 length:597 start_codon:yes stop_codon:yes gene_type:complete
MKVSKINKLNQFISGWYINKKVCTDLIKYFEDSPNQQPGKLFVKGEPGIDKKHKLSTDVFILHSNQDKKILNYSRELEKVVSQYKKQYTYCDWPHDNWSLESYNIQRYKPNEGYFKEHCERTGIPTAWRHLTYMTYLNDVKEGGETEFIYQKLKIKPETGLTLVWGTDWTTTHRGIVAKTETKYIITGWFSYLGRYSK